MVILLMVSVIGFAYVHLQTATQEHAAPVTGGVTSPSSESTTTTVGLPVSLKPSAEDAATALVSSWAAGDRQAALSAATPAAVTALFSAAYTNGLAEDRGCTTSFSPIVCTFGPPGGANPNDPIYQIEVTQALGGWYVSSIRIEN